MLHRIQKRRDQAGGGHCHRRKRVSTMTVFSRNQALSHFVKPYLYDAVAKKIRQAIEARGR